MPKKLRKSAALRDLAGDHVAVYDKDTPVEKRRRRPVSAVESTIEKAQRPKIAAIGFFHAIINFLRDGLPGGDFMAFLVFSILVGVFLAAPLVLVWAVLDPSAFDFSTIRTQRDEDSLNALGIIIVALVLIIPITLAFVLRLRYVAHRSARGK